MLVEQELSSNSQMVISTQMCKDYQNNSESKKKERKTERPKTNRIQNNKPTFQNGN